MKGLNQLYFLKIEIKELRDEITNLTELSSSEIKDAPSGSSISDPTYQYVIKKQKLIEMLEEKIEKYIDELMRIENIIDNIEDSEVRIIARLRFIKNLKWEEIGIKMHMDRSVCYKKLKNYFKGKK